MAISGFPDFYSLLLTLLVTIGMQLAFFAIAYACRFDKVTDLAGSANFVLLAILTLCVNGFYHPRQIIITVFVIIWGLRLGGFLLVRVLERGKDERFDEMRDNFFKFLGFWVFQMFWVWTVSLAVTFLNSSAIDVGFDARDYIGWILWVVGFIVESIADFSKRAFNKNPANKGKLLRSGVWKYSRHPNYFGEIICWIGIWLSASVVFIANTRWAYVSIASPLITFILLMFLSGVPLAEDRYDQRYGKEEYYKEYKNETSPLIPLPTSGYSKIPAGLKRLFLCEFDMYSRELRKAEEERRQQEMGGSATSVDAVRVSPSPTPGAQAQSVPQAEDMPGNVPDNAVGS